MGRGQMTGGRQKGLMDQRLARRCNGNRGHWLRHSAHGDRLGQDRTVRLRGRKSGQKGHKIKKKPHQSCPLTLDIGGEPRAVHPSLAPDA